MAIKFGISGRIAGIIVLVAVASAAISGGMSVYISRQQFSNYVSFTGQKQAERLSDASIDYYLQHRTLVGLQSALVKKPPQDSFPPPSDKADPRTRPAPVRFTITDIKGQIMADSSGKNVGQTFNSTGPDLTRYPLRLENGKLLGYIYIGNRMPLGPGKKDGLEFAFHHQIRLQTGLSALIAAFLSLAVGVLLAQRIVAPIGELTSGIHQLAAGNFGVRIKPRGDKEIYQLTEEFNQMAQQLQNNEENRRTLMANIAHEIRTPLTILRGELEALQSGRIEASEEVVSCLIDEIIRLTRLVKDFESLSLAEAGGLSLNVQPLQVSEIMDSLMPLKLLMEQDRISFQTRIDPEVKMVYADPHRLTQILINLITNATKNVGQQGSIHLQITPAENAVQFEIRDNGPGIAEEDLPRVFTRFFSSGRSSDGYSGGTGLGLAIAKSFVEAHGGTIWAKSKVDEETSFFFTLPNRPSIPPIIDTE